VLVTRLIFHFKKGELKGKDKYKQAKTIVESGKCPDCGSPLSRNNTIAGWWQCLCYPSESMRKDEFKGMPQCNFQTFAEAGGE